MKTATLIRKPSTDEGTPGLLQFGDKMLYSMELPWRDNEPGKSCIPTGTYRAEVYESPRHGRVYMLQGVPGRSDIEIHAANFAGDKSLGWACELLGCIAPAESIGRLVNLYGADQLAGLHSRDALTAFMIWAAGDPIQVVIQ